MKVEIELNGESARRLQHWADFYNQTPAQYLTVFLAGRLPALPGPILPQYAAGPDSGDDDSELIIEPLTFRTWEAGGDWADESVGEPGR
jgi:hypothetical protein